MWRQRRRVVANRQPATRPQPLEDCFHDDHHACSGKPTRDPLRVGLCGGTDVGSGLSFRGNWYYEKGSWRIPDS